MHFCTGTAELKLVTHILNDTLFYCVRCNGNILKININAKYINIYILRITAQFFFCISRIVQSNRIKKHPCSSIQINSLFLGFIKKGKNWSYILIETFHQFKPRLDMFLSVKYAIRFFCSFLILFELL